ncbi:HIRAN domain-containing protein [Curtobacterium sp. MCBA15_004]|uniref:HIRAN domain-containing protein n=1 Tax=unclassified Curtobacterium TaxID=257496 RepID=UPI001587B4DD|nr:HIRAN domain-containing protein [Curtobacterium sp. MCBA15_004]WIA96910.1 HIRAN domain-containing protein [Curtobacterium sp. MCBA15_004]
MAKLSYDADRYFFDYLPAAKTEASFRPLMGFRDLDEHYESDELFPLFHERVMDPARDDFRRVVEGLDLDPDSATPWEQLSRSGGGSEGDTLQVTPIPHETAEGWACRTLLSGLRYFEKKSVQTQQGRTNPYSSSDHEKVLASIRPGDHLRLRREIGNSYNPSAVLVFTEDDHVVGYLPDWLARFVGPVLDEEIITAQVDRVNPSRAGWHLRLLVTVASTESFDVALDRLRGGAALQY